MVVEDVALGEAGELECVREEKTGAADGGGQVWRMKVTWSVE